MQSTFLKGILFGLACGWSFLSYAKTEIERRANLELESINSPVEPLKDIQATKKLELNKALSLEVDKTPTPQPLPAVGTKEDTVGTTQVKTSGDLKKILREETAVLRPSKEETPKELQFDGSLIQEIDGKLYVNPKLNKETCEIIAMLNAKAYANSKRLAEDVYENEDDLMTITENISEESRWLRSKNIFYKKPFIGIHGGHGIYEKDYAGYIAYQIHTNLEGTRHIDIYVVLRGSQGETFHKLGGFGSPSWLTNFDAVNFLVRPLALNVPQKFVKETGIVNLSLHRGYTIKFLSFKDDLKRQIFYLLKEELKIAPFAQIATQMQKNGLGSNQDITKLKGLELKKIVDQWNKCTFQVYCTGHSQGGGVAQVTILYLTSLFGDYIYGPNFDNKILNLVFGIFMSPARAWADFLTKKLYERVVGEKQMLGYSLLTDVITCLPLGHNIGKDKVKSTLATITKALTKVLATLYGGEWLSLANMALKSAQNYETLTHWAFEDSSEVLKKYYAINKKAIQSLISDITQKNVFIEEPEKKLLELGQELEAFSNYEKEENMKAFENALLKAQLAYFKSHQTGWFSTIKNQYHSLMAVKYLLEALKTCGGPIHFIASQHLGAYKRTYTIKPTEDGFSYSPEKKLLGLGANFHVGLLSYDLQKCLNRAVLYFAFKNATILGKPLN